MSQASLDLLQQLVDGGITVGDVTIGGSTFDEYETVAASQTGQTLGATGGTGDYISHILVVPPAVPAARPVIAAATTGATL